MTHLRSCVLVPLLLVGCIHYQVELNQTDAQWHYQIDGEPLAMEVMVVVPPSTREGSHVFKSASAGLANRWHANYGRMFMQIMQVELPQTFRSHSLADAPIPSGDGHVLTLEVTSYEFRGFATHTRVSALLRDSRGRELLDQEYSASGGSGGGKILGLGAFGMKSVVRNSTLQAYREVFRQLRNDLRAVRE